MSSIKYRPEIDGLRAIAVLAVVLFHFGLGFPGGYVGVDIFFVISGYLITSILIKDMDKGRFTFRDFWARRIRRILPASTVMVLAVLVAGYFVLLPYDYKMLGKSAGFQSAFLANHYFKGEFGGYFSEAAELKPLLHTWSLAVEEQFYFVYPFVIFALYKATKKQSTFCILLVVFAFSLLWSCIRVEKHQLEMFFLLPGRAWEMLAGGLIAMIPVARIEKHPSLGRLVPVGAFLIGLSIFLFDSETVFPGPAALLPVLGCAFCILGGSAKNSVFVKMLSWRPLVGLGLISYSLYLWHWPLAAYANHILIEHTWWTKFGLLFLSLLLGYLSWRFIENPFRKTNFGGGIKRVYVFAASCLVAVGIFSVGVWATQGFERGRLTPEIAKMQEDIVWAGFEYSKQGSEPNLLGTKENNFDFVIWGDSHARTLVKEFDESAKNLGMAGALYWQSGTIPIPGLFRPDGEHDGPNNADTKLDVFNQILESGTKDLVLAARWSMYMHECPVSDLNNSLPGKKNISQNETSASTRRQLAALVSDASQAGIRVWILDQVPEVHSESPSRDFLKMKRFEGIGIHVDGHSTSRKSYEDRMHSFWNVLSSEEFNGVNVISVANNFFDSTERVVWYGERSFYRDDNHLSLHGAHAMMRDHIDNMLIEIKRLNNTDILTTDSRNDSIPRPKTMQDRSDLLTGADQSMP